MAEVPVAPGPSPAPIDRGISEFGDALGDYLLMVDGCIGAVLTDDDGNPIDFARRTGLLTVLEVQLIGAQIERPITALRRGQTALRRGQTVLRRGQTAPQRIRVTIDADRGLLLAAAIGADYTLAAIHTAQRDEAIIARTETAFEGLIGRLRLLLDA